MAFSGFIMPYLQILIEFIKGIEFTLVNCLLFEGAITSFLLAVLTINKEYIK